MFNRAFQLKLRSFSAPVRYSMNTAKLTFRNQDEAPLVIVLAGATSVGKSAVAMEICDSINAEIVIADCVQVYKGLNIGSNKPTEHDQLQVPHHALDISDPSVSMTTAQYCRKAVAAISDIISRGKVPVVVGGSTMWIQWLVHGIPDAPKATPELTKRAKDMLREAEEGGNWYAGVAIARPFDPVRVDQLPMNDWYRLRRVIEIGLALQDRDTEKQSSSEKTSAAEKAVGSTSESDTEEVSAVLTNERHNLLQGLDVRCFFLSESREELCRTIDDRCEQMLRAGLVQEVCNLFTSGVLRPEYTVSRAIGYRQTLEYLCQRDLGDGDVTSLAKFAE